MLDVLIAHTRKQQVIQYARSLADHPLLTSCLDWIDEKKLSFDWQLHLHILNFLAAHDALSATLLQDCLQAAAMRWALAGFEHISARGILIVSRHAPYKAVGLWKGELPTQSHRLVELRLSLHVDDEIKYAIAYHQGDWRNARWFCLPEIE